MKKQLIEFSIAFLAILVLFGNCTGPAPVQAEESPTATSSLERMAKAEERQARALEKIASDLEKIKRGR